MYVDVILKKGVLVLSVRGNLIEEHEINDFKRQTMKIFDGKYPKVVIDFSGLERINSDGLGAVTALKRLSAENRIDLKITGITSKLEELLRITKLATVFLNFPTLEDALNSYKEEKK